MSGPNVLSLPTELDFCVSTREDSTPSVIFYIDSRLQKLAAEFFKNVTEKSSMQQALDILHKPHPEYGAFWKRAYGVPEQYMKDGGIDVWLKMLRDLSL